MRPGALRTRHQEQLVCPFGYGLSYTTFSWELENTASIQDQAIEGGTVYSVRVKVTNTGGAAGKEVVQLYGHAPYTPGGIEKPEIALMDFAKTGLLEPGQSETVELKFDPYYLASYDYRDANGNGNRGFELEQGKYALYVMRNAHQQESAIPHERGFQGTVLCDFNTIPAYMNSRQMAYAGGDLNLATLPESWCDESSAADVHILRQNVKNTLYA